MNFSGWIPLRRGLAEHTMDGRLSSTEALALMYLILLADKASGCGKINAPVLRTFLPDLTRNGAKRVLCSLEEKRYIIREIIPRSPLVYRYWVDKFEPSTGSNKLSQLDLSKAFATKQLSDIRYRKREPDGGPARMPDGGPARVPDGEHYYNTDTDRDRDTDNPSVSRVEGLTDASWNESGKRSAQRSMSKASAHEEAHMEAFEEAHMEALHDVSHTSKESEAHSRALLPVTDLGIRWSGNDGACISLATRRPVPHETVCRLIAPLGLIWEGGQFSDLASGEVLGWEAAQARIGGIEGRSA